MMFDTTWKNRGILSIGNSIPLSSRIGIMNTTAQMRVATSCESTILDTNNPIESASRM